MRKLNLKKVLLYTLAGIGVLTSANYISKGVDSQHRDSLQRAVLILADKDNDGEINDKELRQLGIDLGILNKENNIYTRNELSNMVLNVPYEKYQEYILIKRR